MTSTSEVMKYEKRGSTAWLTMNRPHAMNAFNTELRNGLVEAIERATADPDILSIVLTGEGGRAFSAGADLKEVARRDVTKTAPPSPRAATSFFTTVADCPSRSSPPSTDTASRRALKWPSSATYAWRPSSRRSACPRRGAA